MFLIEFCMEVIGHFIFELFKIGILSVVYATLLLLIRSAFLFVQRKDPKFGKPRFFQTYRILYGLLFVFSFTYYGDHGLGDESKIPIGYRETMSAGDLNAYFVPNGGTEQVGIKTYLVSNDYLCAATDSGFMAYNLSTGRRTIFDTEQQYKTYAIGHNLPAPELFLDFFKQYHNYWSGWRFWTMP